MTGVFAVHPTATVSVKYHTARLPFQLLLIFEVLPADFCMLCWLSQSVHLLEQLP